LPTVYNTKLGNIQCGGQNSVAHPTENL
jgi:hypothetical protein